MPVCCNLFLTFAIETLTGCNVEKEQKSLTHTHFDLRTLQSQQSIFAAKLIDSTIYYAKLPSNIQM